MSYGDLVEQLVTAGVPRDRAEARALREFPDAAAQLDADVVRKENVLEKAEQAAIAKMARAIGMKVYNLSQARAAKQSPGLPDLWITHEGYCFAGWFETKRQVGGKRSTAQLEFAQECQRAGVVYGFGDRYDFARWLTKHGFTAPPVPE